MKPIETTRRLTKMKPSRLWLLTAIAAILLSTAAACASGPAGTSQTDSGIRGIITYGPTCPVQRVGGPSCVRPYSTEVTVQQNGRTVTTFHSAANGSFHVSLSPGTYTLTSTKAGLPFLRPLEVTVRAHAFTTITVEFDSGIR